MGYRAQGASAVIVNAGRLDFDRRLDFSVLEGDVKVCHDTEDPSDAAILERVAGRSVVVTKEIPIPGRLISQFPPSVKLIVEAGIGFNNIDLNAARDKGIAVCNVP